MSLDIAARIRKWFDRQPPPPPCSQWPSQQLDYVPIWKKDATPGERLREIALIADKHPHRFGKLVVVYTEENEKGIYTRMAFGSSTRTSDAMGLLTLGQHRLWHDTHD